MSLVYDYYVIQNKNDDWVDKFKSSSSNKSGKLFSFINTNFRKLLSFCSQFEKFLEKNGIPRKDWNSKQLSGGDKDKHRIKNLLNAKFIEKIDDTYLVTSSGYVLKDIIEGDFNDDEKWILLFFLMLHFEENNSKYSIYKKSLQAVKILQIYKISVANVIEQTTLIETKRSCSDLIRVDLFWWLSFLNDDAFLKLYVKNEDKSDLYNFVSCELRNPNSKDCIGSKYGKNSIFSIGTFKEQCKILCCCIFMQEQKNQDIVSLIKDFVKFYKTLYCKQISDAKIVEFLNQHKSIYNKIYFSLFQEVIKNER